MRIAMNVTFGHANVRESVAIPSLWRFGAGGERAYYLIARCECCALEAIGSELLSAAGCEHVANAVGSGMRPALRR